MTRWRSVTCSCLLGALAALGCGKKRQMFDRFGTEISEGGHFETAWVDPQIVISDSLFTLIRAERIDSFYVNRSAPSVPTATTSLTFYVSEPSCPTTVNLVNSAGEVVEHMLVRNLRQGYYKLSVDPNRFPPERYLDTHLYIKADYCGRLVTQPVGQKNSR